MHYGRNTNASQFMEHSFSEREFGMERESGREADFGEVRMEPKLQSALVTRNQKEETPLPFLHRTGSGDFGTASRTAGKFSCFFSEICLILIKIVHFRSKH